MGGNPAIIASVFSNAVGLLGTLQGQKTPDASNQAAEMAAERAAQAEEQRKQEADERKRQRDKVTEARTLEKSRLSGADRQTTLANGGAGLTEDAAVATAQLKTKLGQ